jgi:hypothetical protein
MVQKDVASQPHVVFPGTTILKVKLNSPVENIHVHPRSRKIMFNLSLFIYLPVFLNVAKIIFLRFGRG